MVKPIQILVKPSTNDNISRQIMLKIATKEVMHYILL